MCLSKDFFYRNIINVLYVMYTTSIHNTNAQLGILVETTILDSFYTSANGENSCSLC